MGISPLTHGPQTAKSRAQRPSMQNHRLQAPSQRWNSHTPGSSLPQTAHFAELTVIDGLITCARVGFEPARSASGGTRSAQ